MSNLQKIQAPLGSVATTVLPIGVISPVEPLAKPAIDDDAQLDV